MKLPEQRWLQVVLGATSLVFAGVVIYLYGFSFFHWIESDAAVTGVLASKALAAKSPIVTTWYYANGDVWGVAPHLLAVLPVALFGLGHASLLIAVLIGFALEVLVLVRVYTRLAGGVRWVGVLAMMATLMAWSSAHVAFGYIQLAYGFLTMLCMLSFGWFTRLATEPMPRWKWIAGGVLVALISIQNPTRTVAFTIGPILAACAWPWRGMPRKRRILVAATAFAALVVSFLFYAKVLVPTVAFSVPRGHLDFVLVHDLGGVGHNLSMLFRGLAILCGGGSEPGVRSIPGALLLIGAFILVVREVLGSRELTPMRFICVLVLAQTGIVLVPLVAGNLLVDLPSVRYLMPSLLEVFGLAVILAVRALDGTGWLRKVATGWLVVVPLTAAIGAPDARPPTPERYIWPDATELDTIADELVRRGQTRGYAIDLSANLLTLDGGGQFVTCPIYFRDLIIPQRWLADTSCFDAAKLPETFFIVLDKHEHARNAVAATLPKPIDSFSVGETYEVNIYQTATTPLAWLDLPLPENDRTAFPLHIPATHLQLRHGKVIVDGKRLVATGETGSIIYGPYITLPRGHYTVRWIGNGIASPGEVKFLVVADGKETLVEHAVLAKDLTVAPGTLAEVTFKLGAPRGPIELIAYSQDGGRAALDEIVIERK